MLKNKEMVRKITIGNPAKGSTVKVGLCRNRHEMPIINDYIYNDKVDIDDFYKINLIAENYVKNLPENVKEIDLYLTGLQVCTLSLIKSCLKNNKKLICYHYNKNLKEYIPQKVL